VCSLTTPNAPPALVIDSVTKSYRLYQTRGEHVLDAMGLSPIFFWRRPAYSDHPVLADISLTIAAGERVALVGRNGAGKTTLLKLITGNFQPTSGRVVVNGRVQALMNVGIGFHPEFTGRENVKAALAYSGMAGGELEHAIEDVIAFAELGEYLDQPFKTYSAGMQARLMFAASTAIEPEILIVDEILGAGDAYFSAKSAHRMERLASNGCTLLLVSHSMSQVLQFCTRAIWLEGGKIVMDRDALAVVKAYEEFSHRLEVAAATGGEQRSVLGDVELRKKILAEVFQVEPSTSSHSSAGGISRWSGGEPGFIIDDIRVVGEDGSIATVVRSGAAIRIEFDVRATLSGRLPCTFVVVLFTADGRVLSRHCSEEVMLTAQAGDHYAASLTFSSVLLGTGSYFFSAAVYKEISLENLAAARPYDLLSRSFEFKVRSTLPDDPSLFRHPATWTLGATLLREQNA